MIAVMLLLTRFASFVKPEFMLIAVPGLIAGVAYAALHKKVMPVTERLKALLPFLLAMGASSYATGLRQAELYSLGFVVAVSTALLIAYALSSFITLWLGSFAYARLTGVKHAAPLMVPFALMKNSYMLGLMIVAGEMAFNMLIGLFTSSGARGGSAVLMAFFAGSLYARWHKKKMPRLERVKALLIYFAFVILIGGTAFFAAQGFEIPVGILLVIAAVVFGFFGLFMYFALSWGSWLQLRSDEMKSERAAS